MPDAVVATGVVPQLAGGVKLVLAGIGGALLKLGAGAAGELNVVVTLCATGCIPPLFAPAIFSCVRPNAAIPNTAPIAMWNSPSPCRVSGFHWLVTDP